MPRPPLSGPISLLLCLVIATQVGAQEDKGPTRQASGPESQVEGTAHGANAFSGGPGIDVARGAIRELTAAGQHDQADAVAGRMEICQREALARIGADVANLDLSAARFGIISQAHWRSALMLGGVRADVDAALAARREILQIKSPVLSAIRTGRLPTPGATSPSSRRNARRTPEEAPARRG